MVESLTVKPEDNGNALLGEAPDDGFTHPKNSLSASPDSKDEDETIVTPSSFSKPVWPPPKAKSDTPTPTSQRNGNGKRIPQLVGHLPRAEEAAMRTFEELQDNRYQNSRLGRSREALESMTCDCSYVPGQDDLYKACGEGSDCINRLTQVECLEEDCRCRAACQNQRMQRKQHVHIEVVLTEKKGYGLRAGSDIEKDAFIYEYIGDVVSQPTFVKRMRDYAEEGIRHFYFMMLQKDEYIDATKRGGIGRFANHSCSPNCYVAKWTIGDHIRMGIFAKRGILKDEELTFNYNVDRYGHDAQPCYCGEPECVGFLGGKTQTDVAAMDDLYLDALGISEEVEMYGLKGNNKRRGKKLDEDYVPILKSLVEKDIPKVVQAIQQTQSRKVLLKLLTRIKMTEDQSALRQLMRLRGYSLMCNILEDQLAEHDICILVLECISTWPLLQRNKVEDSKIEDPIKKLCLSDNEELRNLAEKLLKQWAELDVGYRIPKRMKGDGGEEKTPEIDMFDDDSRNFKRHRFDRGLEIFDLPEACRIVPLGRTPVLISQHNQADHPPTYALERFTILKQEKQSVADVIAAATRAAEESKKAEEERIAAAQRAASEAEEAKKNKIPRDKKKKKRSTPEEKDALKEKKLMKLVGAIVVKCLSKHRDRFDHEAFKKHAKELTKIISDKEKKSHSYQSGKLEMLSEEKVVKIKKFGKEYIAKLLHRMEKSGSSGSRSRDGHASASSSGLDSRHDRNAEGSKLLSPSDTTQLAAESADGHTVDSLLDLGGDDEEEDEDGDDSGDPSPASDLIGTLPGPSPSVAVVGRDVDADEDADAEMRDVSISSETARGAQTSNGMDFITHSSKLSDGRNEQLPGGKRSRWDQPPPGVPPSKSSMSASSNSWSDSPFNDHNTNL